MEMSLRNALIIAIIGCSVAAIAQFLFFVEFGLRVETGFLMITGRYSGLFFFIGFLSLINLFVSLLKAQKKRGS
jgi:hypothetical protein